MKGDFIMARKIVYFIGGLIELLLGARILLRLFGANPDNSIVRWVYDWSTPLVTPIAKIFGEQATIGGAGLSTNGVFDWTALITLIAVAMIMGILGWVLPGKNS